jgi:hypothetical protein
MKVSYEFDQDPRYGWVRVSMGDSKSALFVVHSEGHGSQGFEFKDGEMTPACICSARSEGECACSGVDWE